MRVISFMILSAVRGAPVAATAATPQQLETSVWQAFKDKKVNAFKAMFAPNYVGIYDEGRADIAGELQGLKTTNIRSFAIRDFNSRAIDNGEDILTTYSVDLKATKDKKDVSGRFWGASVWHRAGNKWLTVYHSEVKAKKGWDRFVSCAGHRKGEAMT